MFINQGAATMVAKKQETSNPLELCKILWDEVKYRHDLIWQRIFIFTTAVVVISIIPYAQPIVSKLLGNWILLAPLLATLLAIFAFVVMQYELSLLQRIATAYVRQQNRLLDDEPKHDLSARGLFDDFVRFYLIILVTVSLANVLIVWLVWVPALASATPDIFR
jgi:hypothetical protein